MFERGSERYLDPDERPRPAQSQIWLCSEQRDVPEVVSVLSHELGSEMNEGGMEFVNAGRASVELLLDRAARKRFSI